MSMLQTRDYRDWGLVCPQGEGEQLWFMFFVSVGVVTTVVILIGSVIFFVTHFAIICKPLRRYLDARSDKKAQKKAEAEARRMRLTDLEGGHGDVAAGKGFDKAMEL